MRLSRACRVRRDSMFFRIFHLVITAAVVVEGEGRFLVHW